MTDNNLMKTSDAYRVLHLTYGASEEEVARAYKTLARTTHPDKPGGSKEKFQTVKLAYDSLK